MVVIGKTLDFVRCRGLTASAGRELEATLPAASGSAGELREQLLGFVVDESSKVRQGERLPGTTEDSGVVFREAEGSRGWAVQKRLYGAGAQPRGDGLDMDSRDRRRSTGAVPGSGRSGLVSKELRAISPIPTASGIWHTAMRNKSGINDLPSQEQLSTAPGRGSVRVGLCRCSPAHDRTRVIRSSEAFTPEKPFLQESKTAAERRL